MVMPGEAARKTVYDEKRENKFLLAMLDPDSWVAKGKGIPPPPGGVPAWWPDGRDQVIWSIRKRKLMEAGPALLKVLQEKGKGLGYLADDVIPALVELGYVDAVPELERIAASKPRPGEKEAVHPYTLGSFEEVRGLAANAVKKLKDTKR